MFSSICFESERQHSRLPDGDDQRGLFRQPCCDNNVPMVTEDATHHFTTLDEHPAVRLEHTPQHEFFVKLVILQILMHDHLGFGESLGDGPLHRIGDGVDLTQGEIRIQLKL